MVLASQAILSQTFEKSKPWSSGFNYGGHMHMLFPSEKCNNVKQLFQEGHTDDQQNSSTMHKLYT